MKIVQHVGLLHILDRTTEEKKNLKVTLLDTVAEEEGGQLDLQSWFSLGWGKH